MNEAQRKRILLVEDQPLIRMMEAKELEDYGYDVLSARTGENAVELFETEKPIDLILMDIDLGAGIDGTEAARRILKIKAVPIVFLSSHTERDVVEKTEAITSYGYVVKNSGVVVLDASIKMAFRLFQLRARVETELAERKRIEEKLIEQERTSVTLLQESPICTKIVDRDFNLQFMSDAGFDMLRLSKDNHVYGSPYPFVFFPDEFKRRMTEAIEQARSTKAATTNEGRTCDSTGSDVSLQSTIVPILDDEGNVDYYIVFSMDVSRQKESTEHLKSEKETYFALFDGHPMVQLLVDPKDGRIAYANTASTEFYGYSRERLLGLTIYDLNQLSYEEISAEMERAKNGGENHFEFRHRTASGDVRDVDVTSCPLTMNGHEYLQSVIRDVTEEKIKQEELRKVTHDLQERVKELNCIQEFARIVEAHGSVSDIIRGLLDTLQRAWQYPEITSVRITYAGRSFLTSNFSDSPWQQSADIIADDEKVGEVSIAYLEQRPEQDEGPFLKEERSLLEAIAERLGRVIERIQKTQEYSFLFDTLNEAVLRTDVDDRITTANHAAVKLVGRTYPGELLGLPFASLYAHPETRPALMRKLHESQGEVRNTEILLKRKDESTVWTLCNIKLLKNTDGDTIGTLAALRDVSARKRTTEELQRLQWLLTNSVTPTAAPSSPYSPSYGDVTTLNAERVILDAVGKESLKQIAEDAVDLLSTSVSVYERNGDYAFGMFSSGWCQFLDLASRNLCGDVDNRDALACGKWLCHENCWHDSAHAAIRTGQPTDIACIGGLHMYAVPIVAGDETVGAINIGYGDPPTDETALLELATLFSVDVEEIRARANAYESRPPYIVELAKKRLQTAARLIGEIVERKKAEDALVEYQTILSNAEAISDVGSFELDVATGKLTLSDGWLRIHGCANRTLDAEEVRAIVHPDDLHEVRGVFDEAIKHASPFADSKHRILRQDNGEVRIMRAIGKLTCDTDGRPAKIYGAVQDITQQEHDKGALLESKEQFQTLVSSSPFPIGVADTSDEEILYWSKSAEEMFGHRPSTVSEWYALAYPDPDYRQEVLARWKSSLERARHSTTAVNTGEHQIACRDGTVKTCEIYAQLTPDQLIATFHDVSERKQQEREIQRQLAEKETLLKEVHHRTKNNLIQVETLLSLQARSTESADAKSALHEAMSRVRSTRTLYEKLLIGEGFTEVSVKNYLESLIQSLMEVWGPLERVTVEKNIEDFVLPSKSAVSVGIILNELLTNVFKYSFVGRDEGRVFINVEKSSSGMTLTVEDDGVGFDTRKIPNKTPGFGITIVKMLAEQFDGTFAIDGENGTTSIVTLRV